MHQFWLRSCDLGLRLYCSSLNLSNSLLIWSGDRCVKLSLRIINQVNICPFRDFICNVCFLDGIICQIFRRQVLLFATHQIFLLNFWLLIRFRCHLLLIILYTFRLWWKVSLLCFKSSGCWCELKMVLLERCLIRKRITNKSWWTASNYLSSRWWLG